MKGVFDHQPLPGPHNRSALSSATTSPPPPYLGNTASHILRYLPKTLTHSFSNECTLLSNLARIASGRTARAEAAATRVGKRLVNSTMR